MAIGDTEPCTLDARLSGRARLCSLRVMCETMGYKYVDQPMVPAFSVFISLWAGLCLKYAVCTLSRL